MTISAQSIIQRVVVTLQDITSIRWTVSELCRYFNDGQRETALHRPDAMNTTAAHTLVAGDKQSIPANGLKLIEVLRNSGGAKRAIRQCSREILDAQVPNWRNIAGTTEILHFMFDPREPKTFYVYPPAGAGASVEMIYAAYPTNISEAIADGATFTAVTGDMSLPDIFANALQDYILYRAYSKDSEYAGNAQRAIAHYTAFTNALGVEVKATLAAGPSVNSDATSSG